MAIGLVSFKVKVASVGDFARVTVYLSEPAPNGAKWYRYDIINGWQEYPYATFSPEGTYVTLEVKDGDYGDADGVANGIIVDPSGPGIATPAAQPSGNDGGGGGCFIGVASF